MRAVTAGGVGAATVVPVVWDFLGFHFEAGPFVVTVCATLMTRLIVLMNARGRPRWALDITVTALCVLIAALWTQSNRLSVLPAGVTGIAFGALGIGIISFAKSQAAMALRAAMQTFLRGLAADPPTGDPGRGIKMVDQDANLLEKLDQP